MLRGCMDLFNRNGVNYGRRMRIPRLLLVPSRRLFNEQYPTPPSPHLQIQF